MSQNKETKKHKVSQPVPAQNTIEPSNDAEGIPASLQEFVDVMPDEKKQDFLNALVSIERSSSFAGPLPHPDLYGGYEKILPGSANRILAMAEKQLDCDAEVRKMEQKTNSEIVKGVNSAQKRGQYMGFAVVIFVAVLAAFMSYLGHDGIGMVFVGAMASVAAVFALRKWPKDKDNANQN